METNSAHVVFFVLWRTDYLLVEQESAYVSREMCERAEGCSVCLDKAHIENTKRNRNIWEVPWSIETEYQQIRTKPDRDESDYGWFKMPVCAIIATVGPAGLCSVLSAVGVVPRSAKTTPVHLQLTRARFIDQVMKDIQREYAKRKVTFGLWHSKGPRKWDNNIVT